MIALRAAVDVSNGYERSSAQVVWLCDVLASWPQTLRAEFLAFATGCPALGPGGLAALSPPLKVTRRMGLGVPVDTALPTASTCFNQVKLPPYSTKAVLEAQLRTAVEGSRGCIDFS